MNLTFSPDDYVNMDTIAELIELLPYTQELTQRLASIERDIGRSVRKSQGTSWIGRVRSGIWSGDVGYHWGGLRTESIAAMKPGEALNRMTLN